jgi:hypothetical protein
VIFQNPDPDKLIHIYAHFDATLIPIARRSSLRVS